jgi:hypothetical protein
MLVSDWRVSVRAAYLVAKMIPATTLPFTYKLTFEMMVFLLMAFYLASLESALTALINNHFA